MFLNWSYMFLKNVDTKILYEKCVKRYFLLCVRNVMTKFLEKLCDCLISYKVFCSVFVTLCLCF